MILAIRHGERADDPLANEAGRVKLHYDPPLSKHGEAQAHMTGKYIRDMICNLERSTGESKRIIILSSPFLRCIQTALFLSSGLEYFHKNTIYVTNEISEIQKSKFFDRNVLQDLHIRKHSFRDIISHHDFANTKGVKIKEKSFSKITTSTSRQIFSKNEPNFPENISECSSRFAKARKHINEKYLPSNSSNTIVIVVTHSIGVQCMIHELEPEKEIPTIDYCSLTQIKYHRNVMDDERSEEIALKNYNEHIKMKVPDEKKRG